MTIGHNDKHIHVPYITTTYPQEELEEKKRREDIARQKKADDAKGLELQISIIAH